MKLPGVPADSFAVEGTDRTRGVESIEVGLERSRLGMRPGDGGNGPEATCSNDERRVTAVELGTDGSDPVDGSCEDGHPLRSPSSVPVLVLVVLGRVIPFRLVVILRLVDVVVFLVVSFVFVFVV